MATEEATHGDAQPAPSAAGKRRREAGHTPRPTPAALGNAETTMATVMGTGPKWGESPGATWAVAQAQGKNLRPPGAVAVKACHGRHGHMHVQSEDA